MLDRVAKHNWVAAVPTAHTHRRFVGVFVVLDVGKRYALRFEGVAELSIQQLDRDVVTNPHFGDLIEQLVPVFPRPLMDRIPAPVLGTLCHGSIFAPGAAEDKGNQPRRTKPLTDDANEWIARGMFVEGDEAE